MKKQDKTPMLDLSPETENRLSEYAAREGVNPDEAINRLLRTAQKEPRSTAKNNPMLQRLQAQLRQAEQATSDEVAQANAEWLAFQQNMDAPRRANGERLLFPEVPSQP